MSGQRKFLVVGLGNPGTTYAKTRHNAGVWVLDELNKRFSGSFRPVRSAHSLVSELSGEMAGVTCAFPQTFMNESGRALRSLGMRSGASLPDHLIVVHDELDLPPGSVRVKLGGGLAGHNGLRSIAAHLGSQDFIRIRVGIGKPSGGADAVLRWVLSAPSRSEQIDYQLAIDDAAQATVDVVTQGVQVAMNRHNGTT